MIHAGFTLAAAGLSVWPAALLGVLLAFAVAALAVWAVTLGQIARTRVALPTGREALHWPEAEALLPAGAGAGEGAGEVAGAGEVSGADPVPRVGVVIPAHNEAGVIGLLAASLRAQDYPRLRVVFALDRCTDGTRAALEAALRDERGRLDERFAIVEVDRCAPGWAGKVHALWWAVEGPGRDAALDGCELLLFADADTIFDPACVRAAVALLRRRRVEFLSLLSTLTARAWFERLVQTAAGLELMRQYPPVRANRREHHRRRPFANGQFMLFTRRAYAAVGGHAGVKDELLEDVALSRRVAMADLPAGVFLAGGVLRCRMYADWAEFRRGWKRIYIEVANRRPERLRRSAGRKLVTGVALPLGALSACAGGAVAAALHPGDVLALTTLGAGAAAVLVMLLALGWAYRLIGARVLDAPGYVAGAWLTAGILREAARDLERGIGTSWGGMVYARSAR